MVKKAIGAFPSLYPMPLVLIGALVDEKPNYMPAAFVGILNFRPPILACGLGTTHYTSKGIEQTQFFSVNIPSENLMLPTDYCGLHSGEKEDKSAIFSTFYGNTQQAPLIEECPVNYECKLINSMVLGNDTAYFGEIIEVYADEDVLTKNKPDILKIKPFVFSMPDNGYYTIGNRIGTGMKSGNDYKPNHEPIDNSEE
jgi:flavin reductase (DIM6/NTAB) family NADH-FMN oxidoreductase RutF